MKYFIIIINNYRVVDKSILSLQQSQEEISEDRVRYLSFMGIGKDERLCGYVMANEPDRQYLCHVFHCTPNAAALTKALEEACQLRYQKCLDAYPEMAAKAASATPEVEQDKTKDKVRQCLHYW